MKSLLIATSLVLMFASAHGADKKKPLPAFPTHTDPKSADLITDPQHAERNNHDPAQKFTQSCKNANGVKLFENDPGYESCVYEKNKKNQKQDDSETPTRN